MWFTARNDEPVTDEDLSAFADGRLPQRRAARVASHLRSCPSDADRIHDYWRQEAALYQAFKPALEEPVPRSWHDAAARTGRFTVPVWSAAAVLVLAVTAALTVWQKPAAVLGDSSPDLAATALQAYAQQATTGAAENGVAPEFPALDLQPLGQRYVQLGDRRVTEYRYRDAEGDRLALYTVDASTPGGDGLFRLFEKADTRLVEWTADGKRYALVGKGGASELTRLAVQLRHSMTAPAAAVAGAAPAVPAASGETVIDTGGQEGTAAQAPSRSAPSKDFVIQTGEM